MIESSQSYLLRKVAGRFVKLDPDMFYDPRIMKASLMLESGRRVVVCDYKNKKYYALPRLILNAKKGEIIDHINRDPLDNRRCNLRIVTARQSVLNRRLHSNTGFIGVSRTKRTDRPDRFYYEAYFQPENAKRKKFYAPFTMAGLVLAACARDKFVLECGDEEYAPLNFPLFKREPFRNLLLGSDLNEFK